MLNRGTVLVGVLLGMSACDARTIFHRKAVEQGDFIKKYFPSESGTSELRIQYFFSTEAIGGGMSVFLGSLPREKIQALYDNAGVIILRESLNQKVHQIWGAELASLEAAGANSEALQNFHPKEILIFNEPGLSKKFFINSTNTFCIIIKTL